MKKTLTAIALFAALATGATTVSANPHAAHNEGLQNYYYYFGAPCCERPMAMAAPCGVEAPCGPVCEAPCGACAPIMAPVEYEQVCRNVSCDPCASGFNIMNPFTYFG